MNIVIALMIFGFSLPAFWLGYIFINENRFTQFIQVLSDMNNTPAPITKETIHHAQILGKGFIGVGIIIFAVGIARVYIELFL